MAYFWHIFQIYPFLPNYFQVLFQNLYVHGRLK